MIIPQSQHQRKIHQHNLTPGLVRILRKIKEQVKKTNKNKIHLQNDLFLSHSEFANLQKLKYFGLLEKYWLKGLRHKGYWKITKVGGEFLRNERSVPKMVKTLDNQVVECSDELVKINEFYNNAYSQDYWQEDFKTELFQESLL